MVIASVLVVSVSVLTLWELRAWLRGESRLVRWWCRNVAQHRYAEGTCERCGDTIW